MPMMMSPAAAAPQPATTTAPTADPSMAIRRLVESLNQLPPDVQQMLAAIAPELGQRVAEMIGGQTGPGPGAGL